MRTILAALCGYAAWTALWLGGNAAFFGEAAEVLAAGERYEATGPLLAVIALSVACSIAAGFVAARIGAKHAKRSTWIAALLLLVTGIGVQLSAFDQLPLWYHGAFLALIVPLTLFGARLASPRPGRP